MITVADLNVTGLWGPLTSDRVGQVVERMTAEDFDIAPVMETTVRRYVSRKELEQLSPDSLVEKAAIPISADDLVTANLPLPMR